MTYVIERLGHLGDGIADGPVYAPRTLPGEEVTGTLDGDTLRDIRIETPSANRVRPPCRHFGACGACQLQHAADDFVENWKRKVVETALEAQGLSADVGPVVTSPPGSRRRATLAARRTKRGALVGFHGRSSDTITEIPDCQLLHPRLMAAVPAARDLAVTGGSRKGNLAVAVTETLNGPDILVRGGKPLNGPLRAALGDLARRHDLARLSWEDEVIALRLPPEQQFGPARVVPPPGAFLQATAEGEAALRSEVLRITHGAGRIVDLFAGCGTFSLPLAQYAPVHAVEADAAMVAALDAGWRHAQGLKPVTHAARDLFRDPLEPAELAGFEAAVIDPPRAGAHAQIGRLADSGIQRIAHVSCNPVTFARDARTLVRAGYVMGPVRVIDQFRWSAHVELVAEFRREPV